MYNSGKSSPACEKKMSPVSPNRRLRTEITKRVRQLGTRERRVHPTVTQGLAIIITTIVYWDVVQVRNLHHVGPGIKGGMYVRRKNETGEHIQIPTTSLDQNWRKRRELGEVRRRPGRTGEEGKIPVGRSVVGGSNLVLDRGKRAMTNTS